MKLAYRSLCTAVLAVALGMPSLALAAKPVLKAPPADAVDVFDAMKAGDIEVKLVPKDATGGLLMIRNKTKKPLTIKMPEAFAGVPVLAQIGMGGGIGGGTANGMSGGGGQNQGMGMGGGGMGGGGMGGGGMGGGGMGGGGGGGFFNIAPERVEKMKVIGVCLEHGKKDPNPRVAYEIRPLESFTSDPEVIETVKMFARGELDQHTAQAAAWHLTDKMSWEALAAKVGFRHLDGTTEPYFTHAQLAVAMKIVQEAERRVAAQPKASPSASTGAIPTSTNTVQ